MGGGSIQALRLERRRLAAAESLPLGSVRVSEQFLPGEKATPKGMQALRKHVTDELDGLGLVGGRRTAGGHRRDDPQPRRGGDEAARPPDIDVQGFVLTRDAVEELIEELADRPASKRDSIAGIKPDRGDVILGGALALATMMDEGGFEEMEVTEAGLREGIFFEGLLEGSDRRCSTDVRQESVVNLAHRFARTTTTRPRRQAVARACSTSLGDAGVHDMGDAERELLWAACLLHDIGMAIDYDDHHHHSAYLILNVGPARLQPARARHDRLDRPLPPQGRAGPLRLGDLAEQGDTDAARLLCGIIRLAEQLERSRDRRSAP